ncbi:hypothetical protein BDV95DRAFT_301969 [Massariosphaeria phaeospora]|uniref:Uncharacterized protein n=1 Tax=Massariosphaeria phaeospora TaxID=100035 RepID=A0A7C8MEW7_9PLEO|nr:hypothetical protein BDV95DRAFT_301969 [Massariosphaeria phaeospora]
MTSMRPAAATNKRDPVKAVSEMLRDLNDIVRHAVYYCGLDEQSQRSFFCDWVSINNILAAGPPKERNMQLLALLEAGIVVIFETDLEVWLDDERAWYRASSSRFGYLHEDCFDVLVQARVKAFDLDWSPSPFLAARTQNGIFAPFRNASFVPDGIAIERSLNVLEAHGMSMKIMWALGYVVEGAHHYTYVLPCPLSNSRSLRDATTVARRMLEDVILRAVTHPEEIEVLP